MNLLNATISNIIATQELSLVDFTLGSSAMSMVALELDKDLHIGSKVVLGMKATAVSLAKAETDGLSLANQLQTEILSIKKAEILSSVRLKFVDVEIESIITTRSLERLNFQVGDSVTALIKASELSIVEVKA